MFVRSILIAKRQMAFSMAYEWNWITTQAKMDIHPAKKCPSWCAQRPDGFNAG